MDVTGAIVLTVRYGFKHIEFEKGKAGIAVPSKEKLVSVIQTMIAAVRAGELDEMLAQQGRARGARRRNARVRSRGAACEKRCQSSFAG